MNELLALLDPLKTALAPVQDALAQSGVPTNILDVIFGTGLLAIPALAAAATSIALLYLLITYWRLLNRGGCRGWLMILPVINLIVLPFCLCRIAFGKGAKCLLCLLWLIPGVNLIFSLVWAFSFAKAFGRGFWFGLGILFFFNPLFASIVAHGGLEYCGPND